VFQCNQDGRNELNMGTRGSTRHMIIRAIPSRFYSSLDNAERNNSIYRFSVRLSQAASKIPNAFTTSKLVTQWMLHRSFSLRLKSNHRWPISRVYTPSTISESVYSLPLLSDIVALWWQDYPILLQPKTIWLKDVASRWKHCSRCNKLGRIGCWCPYESICI